jgi:hypothetical protein
MGEGEVGSWSMSLEAHEGEKRKGGRCESRGIKDGEDALYDHQSWTRP